MQPNLLAHLSDDDRRRVIASGRRRAFARSEIVFHEGDPADTFHLLQRGHVAIRTTTRLGDVATLTILGPGAGFGELALLPGHTHRTATAAALDDVETISLRRHVFEELRSTHPSIDRSLVVSLAERVGDLSSQLQDAYFAPADERVLRRLSTVCAHYREPGQVGPVTIPISQEVLASIAGTTRSTVNRALREAERRGLLELSRGRVTVTDPDALNERSRA